jgi:hypothetical protein
VLCAFQKLNAKFVFQQLDLPRQRRLGHVETDGSTPKIQLCSDRYKAT